MNGKVSAPVMVTALVFVIAAIAGGAVFVIRSTGPAPGPPADEVMKHIGPDSIREARAAGPPPGPPEPTLPRRHHP